MPTEVVRQDEEAEEEQLTRYKATIEEFWALPESMLPIEYVNGEIIMAPTPTVRHQAVLRNLAFALHEFVLRTRIGSIFFSPLDVVLPSGDVVQPDAFFLTNEETLRANVSKRVQGVPSFLVEVLSPGSIKHDARRKRELYERNNVREYWIVDPRAKTVAQLVRHGEHFELTEFKEGDTIRGVVLDGFETTVGALINDR
ncbi:MAG TPA: Uma2 family endonuclease [Pyrinomonadaceae bacterium]|nr:Uma2 family endonuclease [Pyrinomonadaceae bacterium]